MLEYGVPTKYRRLYSHNCTAPNHDMLSSTCISNLKCSQPSKPSKPTTPNLVKVQRLLPDLSERIVANFLRGFKGLMG
jgi:hypothetical protein